MNYVRKPDKDHRFWLYSPEGDGFLFFRYEADRDEYAEREIREYLDSDNAWYEEVMGVMAGVVTHVTKETILGTMPDNYDEMNEEEREEEWPYEEHDQIADYSLEPI